MGGTGQDKSLEAQITANLQNVRATMHTQQNSVSNDDGNLANVILGDYWWQTAGLDWLDGIEVPQDFIAFGYPGTSHVRINSTNV